MAIVMRASPVIAQQVECSTESGLTAVARAAPMKLLFRNHSSQPRRLYWIDFEGQRKSYGMIAPGQDREQPSSVGNHWVVTEESDKCLAIFAASPAAIFDIE
jgi:hypothetical protein